MGYKHSLYRHLYPLMFGAAGVCFLRSKLNSSKVWKPLWEKDYANGIRPGLSL